MHNCKLEKNSWPCRQGNFEPVYIRLWNYSFIFYHLLNTQSRKGGKMFLLQWRSLGSWRIFLLLLMRCGKDLLGYEENPKGQVGSWYRSISCRNGNPDGDLVCSEVFICTEMSSFRKKKKKQCPISKAKTVDEQNELPFS